MNYIEELHYIWGFGNLVCGELQAYLAAIFELNDDTEIVELLKEKCDSDFSFEIWNADTSPFTYKLHFENGKRVEHCKFSGVVEGYIHNAYDNTPIEGVELKLEGGYKKYTATTTTDENGYFCFEGVLEGNYCIMNLSDQYCFFDSYQNRKNYFDLTAGNTVHFDYKMIPAQNIGCLSVYDIYNGATGEKFVLGDLDDNAKYVVRKGWYNVDGDILYEGKLARPLGYAFDAALPAGKYTITVSAKGYMDYIENINILEGKNMDADCFLIPTDNIQDDTIVMEYVQYGYSCNSAMMVGMNAADADKYFLIEEFENNHVNESGKKVAEILHVGPMSADILYEPEKGNIYSFCIAHSRTCYLSIRDRDFLKNWGDNVKIYKGGKIVKFMNIPYDNNKIYHIFDYDASTDEIIMRNEVYKWNDYFYYYPNMLIDILYPNRAVSLCEDIANEEESFVDELVMEEETEEVTEMEEVTEEESSMEETDEITVEETSEAESTFEEDTEEANKEELDTAEELSEEEMEESPESKSSEAENQNQ